MATIDIITRVDALCKKYEKYDVDKHKQEAMSSSDNYVRLFSQIETDLEVAMQVSTVQTGNPPKPLWCTRADQQQDAVGTDQSCNSVLPMLLCLWNLLTFF